MNNYDDKKLLFGVYAPVSLYIHKHETDKHPKTTPPPKNSDHLKQKHTIHIVDTNKTQHKTQKTTHYINILYPMEKKVLVRDVKTLFGTLFGNPSSDRCLGRCSGLLLRIVVRNVVRILSRLLQCFS